MNKKDKRITVEALFSPKTLKFIFIIAILCIGATAEFITEFIGQHDAARAVELYKKQANLGSISAAVKLGLIYEQSPSEQIKVPLDYAKAAYYYKSAFKGISFAKITSFPLFVEEEKKNIAIALTHLAKLYEQGKGVPVDNELALELLNQAVKLNSKEGAYLLADYYEKKSGTKADFQQALHYYQIAAEGKPPETKTSGFYCAQDKLGYLYAIGKGVPQDDNKAMFWFRAANNSTSRPYFQNYEITEGKNYLSVYVNYRLAYSSNSPRFNQMKESLKTRFSADELKFAANLTRLMQEQCSK